MLLLSQASEDKTQPSTENQQLTLTLIFGHHLRLGKSSEVSIASPASSLQGLKNYFMFHSPAQELYGECHCWWTSESPRAHVAKFYVRLGLIRRVLRASKFSMLKLIKIAILWVYNTIPFGFSLFQHFGEITFQFLKILCLAKDHWRGFSNRNAHMVYVLN